MLSQNLGVLYLGRFIKMTKDSKKACKAPVNRKIDVQFIKIERKEKTAARILPVSAAYSSAHTLIETSGMLIRFSKTETCHSFRL